MNGSERAANRSGDRRGFQQRWLNGWSGGVLTVVVLAAVVACSADGTVEASDASTTAVRSTAPSPRTGGDDASTSTSDGAATSTSTPTTAPPADPCRPRGYVDREGDPLPPDVERPVIDTQ